MKLLSIIEKTGNKHPNPLSNVNHGTFSNQLCCLFIGNSIKRHLVEGVFKKNLIQW